MRTSAPRLLAMLAALFLISAPAADAQARVSKSRNAAAAPATPSSLRIVSIGHRRVTIDWRGSTGASRYHVYRNGKRVARPSRSKFTDRKLRRGKSYRYRISAANARGRSSLTAQVAGRLRARRATKRLSPLFTGDVFAGAGYSHQTSGGSGNTVADVVDPTGSGTKVIRLSTNEETGGDGSVVRSQIIAPHTISKGAEYWQVAHVYVDPRLPANGAWMTIMSSYGAPYNGAGPTGIRIVGDRLVWSSNGRHVTGNPWSVPLVRGKWITIARHEKLSAGSDGFFEIAYSPDAASQPMKLQTLANGKTRWNFPTLDASNHIGPQTVRLQNYHKDNQSGWSGTYSMHFGKNRIWSGTTTLDQLNSIYSGN